jgi:hypothetical protein
VDTASAMLEMDQILKANELSISLVAAVPAFLIAGGSVYYLGRWACGSLGGVMSGRCCSAAGVLGFCVAGSGVTWGCRCSVAGSPCVKHGDGDC